MSTNILRYPPRQKNSPRMMKAFEAIAQERIHQKRLLASGVILFNCDSPIVDDHRKLRVLMEEVGEVAEAIDKLETLAHADLGLFKSLSMQKQKAVQTAREHLRAELKQVAAVAVAWLETNEARPAKEVKS